MSYTSTKFLATNPKANKIALAIHIISWIFQFLGHGLAEKRSPKLLDNLVQGNTFHFFWISSSCVCVLRIEIALVSAPYFVFFEVLFFLGYRPKLYKEVMIEINKDVADFKASKYSKGREYGSGCWPCFMMIRESSQEVWPQISIYSIKYLNLYHMSIQKHALFSVYKHLKALLVFYSCFIHLCLIHLAQLVSWRRRHCSEITILLLRALSRNFACCFIWFGQYVAKRKKKGVAYRPPPRCSPAWDERVSSRRLDTLSSLFQTM